MLLHSLLYYCGFKKDNKRNKGKEGTSSQNSGGEEDFSFCFITSNFTTVDYREAGLLINFLLPFYYPIISPLYYPF